MSSPLQSSSQVSNMALHVENGHVENEYNENEYKEKHLLISAEEARNTVNSEKVVSKILDIIMEEITEAIKNEALEVEIQHQNGHFVREDGDNGDKLFNKYFYYGYKDNNNNDVFYKTGIFTKIVKILEELGYSVSGSRHSTFVSF